MFIKFFKILFFCLLPVWVVAQNTIALPEVSNYSKQIYGGGLQNWKIRQDKNSIIYFANNEGLLTYNGKYWNLYPLPNKTIVHSIEIAENGRIYVGGQDEVGYFTPASNGKLEFHSLLQLFPEDRKSFGDMWDIVSFDKDIFFRTTKGIYKLSGNKITVYNPQSEWIYMAKCQGKLYAQDVMIGLMVWENGYWRLVDNQEALKNNDPITGMVPLPGEKIMVATLRAGLFSLDSKGLHSMALGNRELFNDARIYAATTVNNTQIGLATSANGLIIVDHEGNIVQKIAKGEGLQNNNVLSLLADLQGNIWLGLDNGIDMIAYNSAVKTINPLQQNGSGYTALIHQDNLYIGTTTWTLAAIQEKLLLGHHEGAFEIKSNAAFKIRGNTGFWNFNTLPNESTIVAGTYKGLEIFGLNNNEIKHTVNIPDFLESSRYIAIDAENNIWVSHPYHGIFKLAPKQAGVYSVQKFTDSSGLPSLLNNHIFKIKEQIVAATTKGIYIYNKKTNLFEASGYYKNILGNQSIRYLKESPAGNLWFIHDKNLSVVDFSSTKPELIPIPELNNKILSGFEFVYPYNESNVFVGGEKGFFLINYQKYKNNIHKIVVQVRTVKISGSKDSLLFGGYFQEVNKAQLQSKKIPSLASGWKTIRFEYSSNVFSDAVDLQYSYRLKGFDDKWSDWSSRTEKEYSNLDAGNYTFEVKVRNNINNESAVAGFSFKMLPPWYITRVALVFYFLLILVALFILYKWLKRKFRMQQQRYEMEQVRLKYIHDLEQNKTKNEITELQNEKLEADLSFKNAELAAAAMHLVKKGELLTKIKKDLSQVTKDMRNPETIAAIKQVVKKVGDDDKLDEEWETFARHFDAVHSDYLTNLKNKHTNLTSNELKLCANLRMNLSTKEIAQLMNISVRGVEISRYRLRKKLGISSEINLFDYLIKI